MTTPTETAPGWTRRLWRAALDVVFPRICGACGVQLLPGDEMLCPGCADSIQQLPPTVCHVCGRPAEALVADQCEDCLVRRPPYALGRTCYLYAGPMRRLICSFKYGSRIEVGRWLGRLMAEEAAELPEPYRTADALVPVPLHPARWAERGFNQAEVLARRVARRLGRPLILDNLCRTRNTQRQTGLVARERMANVRGAFDVKAPAKFAGRRLILIDDVVTTGTTLAVCARALRRAGVDDVYVFTLAAAAGGLQLPSNTSAPAAGQGKWPPGVDFSRGAEG